MSNNDVTHTENFTLELLSTNWMTEENTETDLCAHGQVLLIIGNETIVNDGEPDGWAVTAMGLLLLRTLSQNHTKQSPVAEHLIPHCGHSLHFDELSETPTVEILGCPYGKNIWVEHLGEQVQLTSEKGSQMVISFDVYKDAVISFANHVKRFYQQSPAKQLPDGEYDRKAYELLWQEWHHRIQTVS